MAWSAKSTLEQKESQTRVEIRWRIETSSSSASNKGQENSGIAPANQENWRVLPVESAWEAKGMQNQTIHQQEAKQEGVEKKPVQHPIFHHRRTERKTHLVGIHARTLDRSLSHCIRLDQRDELKRKPRDYRPRCWGRAWIYRPPAGATRERFMWPYLSTRVPTWREKIACTVFASWNMRHHRASYGPWFLGLFLYVTWRIDHLWANISPVSSTLIVRSRAKPSVIYAVMLAVRGQAAQEPQKAWRMRYPPQHFPY